MKLIASMTFTKREVNMFKTGDKVVRIHSEVRVADFGLVTEGVEYEVGLVSHDGSVIMVVGSPYSYSAKYFKLAEDKPTFKNMKFRVSSPEHSKEIQEALFEMGYKWSSYGAKVDDGDAWLCTEKTGVIYRTDQDWCSYKEYAVETTKSYKLSPVEIQKETVTIDGKTYDKEAVLKRLAELETISK